MTHEEWIDCLRRRAEHELADDEDRAGYQAAILGTAHEPNGDQLVTIRSGAEPPQSEPTSNGLPSTADKLAALDDLL